jgi:hypothetical protein
MDRTKVDAMTADEVRVAVAKAQGWVFDGTWWNKGGFSNKNTPDYSAPYNYMELMNEIWKKEPDAMIWKDEEIYTVCFRVLQSPKPHIRIPAKELWEAIARAYLIVCVGD